MPDLKIRHQEYPHGRFRHAERLLMQSGLTVSEICYEVGFTSPRYFSKCYKEFYGYLPSKAKRG